MVIIITAIYVIAVGAIVSAQGVVQPTAKDKEWLGDKEAYAYLCTVSNKGCSDHITKLNPKFAECLAKFMKANPGLRITSGYRSPERQAQLFSAAVARYGSEAAARRWVAPPGKSNHNRGIAADLAGAGAQAHSSAAKFGLVFRMSHEPWHIEPSGADCNNGQAANEALNNFGQSLGGGAQSDVDRLMAQNKAAEAQAQQQAQKDRVGGSGSSGGAGAADSPGGQNPQQSAQQAMNDAGAQSALLPLSEASLSCSPQSVEIGSPVTVDWSCPTGSTPRLTTQRKTRVALNGAAVGTIQIKPPANTVYTLSCVKSSQLVAQSLCTVDVVQASKNPEITLTVSEVEVLRNATVDITWSAKNVKSSSCVLRGPNEFEITGNKGVAESDGLTQPTNVFTLSCKSLDGKLVEKEAEVRVVKRVNQSTRTMDQDARLSNPLDDL